MLPVNLERVGKGGEKANQTQQRPKSSKKNYSENKKNLYKNSQTWWDIEMIHRKMLVKFKRFPEDEEDFADVLEELEEDKQRRAERKQERDQQIKAEKEYLKMLRDSK